MKYREFDVEITKHAYQNGRTALQLVDSEGPVCVATVNLPDHPLGPKEVFVKNWSENEGMLDWLVANNIVRDTGRRVQSGFVEAPVAELLI